LYKYHSERMNNGYNLLAVVSSTAMNTDVQTFL
jgi:hypothetical protein